MYHFERVLNFWFGPAPLRPRGKLWYAGGKRLDETIKERFKASVTAALAGKLAAWEGRPRTALALIVLLDQFTRNLFRGTANAFAGDPMALRVCRSGIESGLPDQLHVLEASFFFMPLEHSESHEIQDLCVSKFKHLLRRTEEDLKDYIAGNHEYAVRHRQIIRQFGRYPHRNAVLDRRSTEAEKCYLIKGGATFGQ